MFRPGTATHGMSFELIFFIVRTCCVCFFAAADDVSEENKFWNLIWARVCANEVKLYNAI